MPRLLSSSFVRGSSILVSVLLVQDAALAQSGVPFARAWQSGTPVEVAGVVTVVYADDFVHKRAEIIHTVRDERTGNVFRLRFEKELKNLRSGSRIALRGRAQGTVIYVKSVQTTQIVVEMLDSSRASQTSAASTTQNVAVSGEQSTLVVVANFRDKTLDPLMPGADCSIPAIGDRVFLDPQHQSVDDLYRGMSFGQVSLQGKVVGPFTLQATSTDTCDTNEAGLKPPEQRAAREAAQRHRSRCIRAADLCDAQQHAPARSDHRVRAAGPAGEEA